MIITVYVRPTGRLAAMDEIGQRLYQQTEGSTDQDAEELLTAFMWGYGPQGTYRLIKKGVGECDGLPSYLWTYEVEDD